MNRASRHATAEVSPLPAAAASPLHEVHMSLTLMVCDWLLAWLWCAALCRALLQRRPG